MSEPGESAELGREPRRPHARGPGRGARARGAHPLRAARRGVQYDPGNGLLAFGRSMKMRDLLFALIPHAGWVNLQLADGALLPNPDGLIEGTGKRIRHVKVRSMSASAEPRIREVVRAQLEQR